MAGSSPARGGMPAYPTKFLVLSAIVIGFLLLIVAITLYLTAISLRNESHSPETLQ